MNQHLSSNALCCMRYSQWQHVSVLTKYCWIDAEPSSSYDTYRIVSLFLHSERKNTHRSDLMIARLHNIYTTIQRCKHDRLSLTPGYPTTQELQTVSHTNTTCHYPRIFTPPFSSTKSHFHFSAQTAPSSDPSLAERASAPTNSAAPYPSDRELC